MNSHLGGSTVLITGASGGIGQATARAFAEEGAQLALHYFQNANAIESLCDQLNVPCLPIGADMRYEQQVEAMFQGALAEFGTIDAAIVNAGIWIPEDVPLHEMTLARWNETMAADLTSAFLTCRAFLRHLADQPREHASITLIGSTAAVFGEAEHADYAAAKAGMVYGLTRSLKNEIVRLAPRGRVNSVCPGWTDTPMAAKGLADSDLVDRVTSTMALRKVATADDIARAIVYLTSDHLSGHISGEIITIAGGMEGRLLHW